MYIDATRETPGDLSLPPLKGGIEADTAAKHPLPPWWEEE